MAELVMFFLCDTIQRILTPNDSIIPQAIMPRIVLRPQYIPGNYSFGMIIGIQNVNLREVTRVRYTIDAPCGEMIYASGVQEIPPEEGQDTLPIQYQGFVLSSDIRSFPVSEEGEYKVHVYLNDKELGTRMIPVFKGCVS